MLVANVCVVCSKRGETNESICLPSSSETGDAGSLSPSLPAPLPLLRTLQPLAKYRLLMAAVAAAEEEEEVQAMLDTLELEEETAPLPLME